jgi:predicted class III extradiol MEMO1 family dioxygenase
MPCVVLTRLLLGICSMKVIKDLEHTGLFDKMDKEADEDEHSLEMHLPYIRHVFSNR